MQSCTSTGAQLCRLLYRVARLWRHSRLSTTDAERFQTTGGIRGKVKRRLAVGHITSVIPAWENLHWADIQQ